MNLTSIIKEKLRDHKIKKLIKQGVKVNQKPSDEYFNRQTARVTKRNDDKRHKEELKELVQNKRMKKNREQEEKRLLQENEVIREKQRLLERKEKEDKQARSLGFDSARDFDERRGAKPRNGGGGYPKGAYRSKAYKKALIDDVVNVNGGLGARQIREDLVKNLSDKALQESIANKRRGKALDKTLDKNVEKLNELKEYNKYLEDKKKGKLVRYKARRQDNPDMRLRQQDEKAKRRVELDDDFSDIPF